MSMKDKNMENIAKKIIQLELKCREDKDNLNTYLQEMITLTENLSLEELLELDEYILGMNVLK